jgi:hypothetical protein
MTVALDPLLVHLRSSFIERRIGVRWGFIPNTGRA